MALSEVSEDPPLIKNEHGSSPRCFYYNGCI